MDLPIANAENNRMDDDDIILKLRVRKLKDLVDKAGGIVAFVKKYSKKDADKPISETYVSQILNGHRAFREKAARNMEKRAGLPSNYFDIPDEELSKNSKDKVYKTADQQKQRIIDMVFQIGEQDICDHVENSLRIALGLELTHKHEKQDRRATEDRRHQEEHPDESAERRALKDRRSPTHKPLGGGGGGRNH